MGYQKLFYQDRLKPHYNLSVLFGFYLVPEANKPVVRSPLGQCRKHEYGLERGLIY